MSSLSPNADRTSEAREVARDLYGLEVIRLTPYGGGRVNDTFRMETAGGCFILQRLNDFFQGAPALGLNWRSVRQALAERLAPDEPPLPPVFPDLEGKYLTSRPERDGFWRLTGFLSGRPTAPTPDTGREAARLLGVLHLALNRPAPLELQPLPEGDFTNQFLTGPEDFEVLTVHYRGHPRLEDLKPHLARAAEDAWQLPRHPGFLDVFRHHDVVVHTDPKADNFLFSPEGRATALLDWDCVGLGHVLADLGEMLRSWGGLAPDQAAFDDRLAAVAEGYAETGLPLTRDEVELLPPVLRGLALNLARRYLTDALAEVYFHWDRQAYPSLYEQNLARARKLLDLAEGVLEREVPLGERLVRAYQLGRDRRRRERERD